MKKVLNYEYQSRDETETDDEITEFMPHQKLNSDGSLSRHSNLSGLSLMVKPSNNPHQTKQGGDLSTNDSMKDLVFKGGKANYLSRMSNELYNLDKSSSLEGYSEYTSSDDYSYLPNWDDIKHFEEETSDDSFMDIVVGQLSSIDGDITYKEFRKALLPQHRKPSFTDYARLRRLEKIMLAK